MISKFSKNTYHQTLSINTHQVVDHGDSHRQLFCLVVSMAASDIPLIQ